ncbi:MAG: gamma carbonic anhydrase family protein [Terriglobia bacterium]|jgi:carbonic anhydrase/acetyltransferase-like protein (isoleucine patch superfamily)
MILTLAGRTPRIAGSVYIAPSADVIGDVDLGENSSIWFQCVLRGDIEPIHIGANSNIQDGTVIHTMHGAPATVGDWVTVGHRVVLHGYLVENHCLIGMGAVLLNHAHVGEGSIVAAGAVVAENTVIPPRSLYMGVPAKVRRAVTEDEQAFIRMHAAHYLEYKERYLANETPTRALGESARPQGS